MEWSPHIVRDPPSSGASGGGIAAAKFLSMPLLQVIGPGRALEHAQEGVRVTGR